MIAPGMLRWFALVGLVMASAAGCASSKSGDPVDAVDGDAPTDAPPDPCDGVVCPGLTYCKEGTCVPFPACPLDGGLPGPDPTPMCPSGTACRNGVCIPEDLDIDGDSYPASSDCDEQNPDIHPDAIEACNGYDDNCVDGIDEGDPVLLCEGNGAGNVCMGGACVCADGNFDIDPTIPGCECVAAPAVGQGVTCQTAIDLGSLSDVGQLQAVTGNIPNGRTVWYRFRAVDTPDTSCDNFRAAAKLLTNPDDQFRIRGFRGDCNTAIAAGQFTEMDWGTDLRTTIAGQLTGECPCWNPAGAPIDNVSPCQDSSADFYFAVERAAGGVDTCASFGLELSNGVYDWQ